MTNLAPPTDTPTLTNRIRTVLGWLEDHPDLPGGWTLTAYSTGTMALSWSASRLSGRVAHHLTELYGPGASDASGPARWVEWPAQGDRPELVVFKGLAA